MSDALFSKPARPWRVIVEEITRETDYRRVLKLSEELNRALAQQRLERSRKLQPKEPSGAPGIPPKCA
jgi:hypothetical protein